MPLKPEHFYQDCDGWFWFQNAYEHILDGLPDTDRTVWVEIGVYKGRSLAWLGVEALRAGKSVEIHAVDLVPQPEQFEVVEKLIGLGCQVHLWHGDSAVAGEAFTKQADVVWLDGDHSYEAVTKDIRAWAPHLSSRGIIGGDDYAMEGVRRAVDQLYPKRLIAHGCCTDGPEGPKPYPWWIHYVDPARRLAVR